MGKADGLWNYYFSGFWLGRRQLGFEGSPKRIKDDFPRHWNYQILLLFEKPA
jgi:hypothetical protein